MRKIYLETRVNLYADILMNNTWDLKLTSNWSRAEVGALRNAKKEFWESWCFTPKMTESYQNTFFKSHQIRP